MGRTDKSKKAAKGSSKKSKVNKRYPLVTSDGRRVSKARAHISSTQKGADALNIAYLEKIRDRQLLMILCRLAASGRVQITSTDVLTSARDIRGMPEFI
jgi:hypothetical protein